MVSAIPEGFNSVTAYLIVPNAVEAMEFYGKAFGATQICNLPGPDGKGSMHAEMQIGNTIIMLSDENPQWQMKSPATLGGTPVNFMIYIEDCDTAFEQAVAAGCEVSAPLMDQFWGDRLGKVLDPYGYQWSLATHKEDLTVEQIGERAQEWAKEMKQSS